MSVGDFFSDFWDNNGDAIVDFLVRLAISIAVLIAGVFIIRWLTRLLHKILAQNKRLDPTVAGFFESIFRFALRFILLIIVFDQLGIENTAFIAIAGASVFALAFALQGSLSNLAAGALLLSFRYLKVGDLVEAGGSSGFVRRIEMFTTQLVTPDGKLVYIPNGSVTGDNIVNYTTLESVRLELSIGIDYGDDIHLARKVALDVMENNSMVLVEPAPTMVVVELGDNSVNFQARPWVESKHYYAAMVGILEELKLAFDAAGLSIPFPQRDVHLNLVDTETEPKTYPKWVPFRDRPGGANAFFRRYKKEPTGLFNLLQLSAADQERLAEEEAKDREAGIVKGDKKKPQHFDVVEGDEAGSTDDEDETPESPREVLDLDEQLEAFNDGGAEEDESKAAESSSLRARPSGSDLASSSRASGLEK